MPEDRFNPTLLLTTTEAGEFLAVHPSTIKRWCNEGELTFRKTEGGHRRILLADTLELAGLKGIPTPLDSFSPFEGQVWSALQAALRERTYRPLIRLSMEWLEGGEWDRVAWLFVMLGSHASIPLAEFFDHGVRGFMEEVGEAWVRGDLRVSDEHLASQAVVEALIRLRRPGQAQGTAEPSDLRAVVGAMEGDIHHIGSLCIRLLLEEEGWDVAYLGPNVPVEDLAAVQASRRASLVCISFTPPHSIADANRALRILKGFYDETRPYALALGGSAVALAEKDRLEEGPFTSVGVLRTGVDFLRWLAQETA